MDMVCHYAIDNDRLRDVPVNECPFYKKGRMKVGDAYRSALWKGINKY